MASTSREPSCTMKYLYSRLAQLNLQSVFVHHQQHDVTRVRLKQCTRNCSAFVTILHYEVLVLTAGTAEPAGCGCIRNRGEHAQRTHIPQSCVDLLCTKIHLCSRLVQLNLRNDGWWVRWLGPVHAQLKGDEGCRAQRVGHACWWNGCATG
jgi:hypothetical protein